MNFGFALGNWLRNIGIAVSQLLNSILFGDPEESFSARTGKAWLKRKPWALVMKPVIDFIFRPWEKDHCVASIDKDEGRLALRAILDRGER